MWSKNRLIESIFSECSEFFGIVWQNARVSTRNMYSSWIRSFVRWRRRWRSCSWNPFPLTNAGGLSMYWVAVLSAMVKILFYIILTKNTLKKMNEDSKKRKRINDFFSKKKWDCISYLYVKNDLYCNFVL